MNVIGDVYSVLPQKRTKSRASLSSPLFPSLPSLKDRAQLHGRGLPLHEIRLEAASELLMMLRGDLAAILDAEQVQQRLKLRIPMKSAA